MCAIPGRRGKSTRTKNGRNTARRAAKAHPKKEPARRKPACKRQDTAWDERKAGRNTALVSECSPLSHLDKEPQRVHLQVSGGLQPQLPGQEHRRGPLQIRRQERRLQKRTGRYAPIGGSIGRCVLRIRKLCFCVERRSALPRSRQQFHRQRFMSTQPLGRKITPSASSRRRWAGQPGAVRPVWFTTRWQG